MSRPNIFILDDYGDRLGLDYDYEYRGRRHEAHRARREQRLRLKSGVIAVFFLLLGMWPLWPLVSGTETRPLDGAMLISGLCFFLALLTYACMRRIIKKHRQLHAVLPAAAFAEPSVVFR